MARGVAQRYVDTVQPLLALGARVRKPRSYEASQRMFFEFSNGDSLRMIDESRRAPTVDERFENALRNTAMAWRHAVDRRLRRLGVSRLCWMTIGAAMQARSPLSQSNLADALAISRASMVKTIDCMVKNGLAKRETSASDRRLKRIVVTDAGAHLYSLLKDEAAAVRRRMLGIVEIEKLVQLTEFLERVQEASGHRNPAMGNAASSDVQSTPPTSSHSSRGPWRFMQPLGDDPSA
jgi:MarR family transcriptional regulator, transcriptional regulator for hemolysin